MVVPCGLFLILISILLFSKRSITFRNVFTEAIYPSLVALIMIAVWSLIIVSLQYRRLTQDQLTATWTFSDDGIAVSDAAGNKIIRPWSQIRMVKYSSKGVRVILIPMGSLWIPERFLADDDMVELKSLTKKLNLI